jgi:uncharacterized protein YbaR (Trm112 family)
MKDLDSLMPILCCPSCQGKLKKEENNLICVDCNQSFPLQNGIPFLLDKESQVMLEKGKDEVRLVS